MTPEFEVICADVVSWAQKEKGKLFAHCLLSDTPYHLVSIVKRFGKKGSAPAKGRKENDPFVRKSRGFMHQTWDGLGPDGQGVSFRKDTWLALGELLYPGAFGFAYSGSRTFHRLMIALEDVGYILPPMMYGWAYSTGFSSPTRIDKAKGLTPEQAESWQGYRYGADVLKPALEPIVAFQKPFSDKPVSNILTNGAGTLWVDGGRIPYGPDEEPAPQSHPLGRWPKNLVLTHLPGCDIENGKCLTGCPCALLDGNDKYYYKASWAVEIVEKAMSSDGLYYVPKPAHKEQDLGLEDFPDKQKHRLNSGGLADSEERFQPKARKNHHPTTKPVLASWHFANMLLPHPDYKPRTLLVPFCGSGSEMLAGMLAGFERVIGVEIDPEYCEIARARCAYWSSKIIWGHTRVETVLKAAGEIQNGKQIPMF